MAKENFVNFKKGQSGNLNSQSIENGTFWLTTDDQRLYIDIDDNRLAINANATTTKDGLMPSEDKSKLNYTNIAYGTCSTAAGTAAKVITVSGNTQWALTAGSMITILFSATNTAENPTFNVNGTGAKNVYYGASRITTESLSYAGYKDRPMNFVYDGTQYRFIGWGYDSNTTYTNVKLGHGYATCSTAAATVAKTASLSGYTLTTGGIVSVRFTYDVPANATLNINSKGAKSIYYRNAAITDGIIKAGDTATFIYSSRYHLISIDRWQNDITALQNDKMDKANPTGTGAFSLNRKANTTVGDYSVATGYNITASGKNSHAEGMETTASGRSSHAEGMETTASGDYSHAEGMETTASGDYSHAEGRSVIAFGTNSHAEGYNTVVFGNYSHTEGYDTEVTGNYSHGEGYGTKASSDYQHAQGKYNIEDASGTYAHIVGNGEEGARSNAHTLDWNGNAWYAGTVKVGGTSYADANEVAIKADIATTAMQGTATQNNTYWKIHNFGNWGTGNWTLKGFSMLITSRAGEMVWVSLAANDSGTSAGAFRLVNRYTKIAAIHYSVSESAIYVTAAGWANNICAHILTNINGDYVPSIDSASALPGDAVEINIVEFGIDSTSAVVGDSSVLLKLGGSTDRPTYNDKDIALSSDVDEKVSKSGDTMTGRLAFNMLNPCIHMKDTAYNTNWYFQAQQDQLAFGSSTFADAVKTDKNGNMTAPGAVTASTFKGDTTAAAIRPSDSNEVNFGSNASYLYLGYENRVGSTGKVDTYKFGTHSGAAGATSGNIECGTVKIGSAKLSYDSTNECLNFAFV